MCEIELKLFKSPPINKQIVMKKTIALSLGITPSSDILVLELVIN